jgi:hypothetical protein
VRTRRRIRRAAGTIVRWWRPSPELIILTATVLSALNALVALGILPLAGVHLAVVNVGLASVLGLVARGLLPAEPRDVPAECRAHRAERGST